MKKRKRFLELQLKMSGTFLRHSVVVVFCFLMHWIWQISLWTRCSAIAERPRCKMRY